MRMVAYVREPVSKVVLWDSLVLLYKHSLLIELNFYRESEYSLHPFTKFTGISKEIRG